jgi:mannose-1-phosphate guanylyltransferase
MYFEIVNRDSNPRNLVEIFQLGPNVSIAKNVSVGAGCRIKESIVLANSSVGEHSLVLYTVVGMNAR